MLSFSESEMIFKFSILSLISKLISVLRRLSSEFISKIKNFPSFSVIFETFKSSFIDKFSRCPEQGINFMFEKEFMAALMFAPESATINWTF